MPPLSDAIPGLSIAIGVGLLIGVERERAKGGGRVSTDSIPHISNAISIAGLLTQASIDLFAGEHPNEAP